MPTMRDLSRYVARKHATNWYDIGIELKLKAGVLETIGKKEHQNVKCILKTFDKWLQLNPQATWKTLEVALTNVNRAQLGLDPVDDVYGKCLILNTVM